MKQISGLKLYFDQLTGFMPVSYVFGVANLGLPLRPIN
jgi:hypothetical protein